MKIARISSYKEFRNHNEVWNDLLSRSKANNVFLTYEWIDAAIRYFYKDEELLILKVIDGGKLVGIAPLAIKKYRYLRLPAKAVSFIGTIISDRMDFIIDDKKEEEVIRSILDYLRDIRREWDIIDLREIEDTTGTMDIIERWQRDRNHSNFLRSQDKIFFVDFSGQERSLKKKKFSKKFRKEYRQANNKLRDLNLEFERHTNGRIEAERLFSEICAIENKSWQGRRGTGVFSNKVIRNFHREIIKMFSNNRWLDLCILKLNGQSIAYKYDYLYNQTLYSYNQSFDGAYSYISPGTILMLWSLKDSAAGEIEEYDFLRGEEPWKKRLTDNFRIHHRIRIFKDSFYARFLYYLQSNVLQYVNNKKALRNAWMKTKWMLV